MCSTCNGSGRLKGASLAILQPQSLSGRLVLLPLLFVLICIAGFMYVKTEYLKKAVAAAEVMHREISQGRISQIYIDADERFRMSISFDAAVEQITVIRTRLGKCQYSGPNSWGVSVNGDGVYVLTRYTGHCENGEYIETLRWHIVDSIARLASLRVSSRALLKQGLKEKSSGMGRNPLCLHVLHVPAGMALIASVRAEWRCNINTTT